MTIGKINRILDVKDGNALMCPNYSKSIVVQIHLVGRGENEFELSDEAARKLVERLTANLVSRHLV